MVNTLALAAELTALRSVIAIHTAKVRAAGTVLDAAQAAFEDAYGVHPRTWWGRSALLQAWQAADAAYDLLIDDSGYYWCASRVRDLEIMLEGDRDGQLRALVPSTLPGCDVHVVGLGSMPRPHASVRAFVAATLGL